MRELDKIYIDESIRIRKEYLYNVSFINDIDLEYKRVLSEFEKIKNIIDDIDDDEEDERYNEEYFKNLLEQLNTILESSIKKIEPYTKKIEKLNSDQEILFISIKEKYPDLTNDQIEDIIYPHVVNIK